MKKLLFGLVVVGLLAPTQLFAAGEMSFGVGASGPQVTIDGTGLKLETGVNVNEFSDDTGLAGDESATVPTEHAVKTYVDGKVVTSGTVDFSSPSDSTAPSVKAVKEFVNSAAPGRNFIICGRFDNNCWPEGDEFLDMGDDTYGPVTFEFNKSSDLAKVTLRQSADTPTDSQADQRSKNSVGLEVTTLDGSMTGDEHVVLVYYVTGYDLASMWGKEVTLSFWARAKTAGKYHVAFRNGVSSGSPTQSYVAEYDVTDSWGKKEVTLTLDAASGFAEFEENVGMSITFTVAAGPNWEGTAGSWQSGNKISTSSQVNGVGTTFVSGASKNFALDLVKLEIGNTSTRWVPYVWNENIPSLKWYFNSLEFTEDNSDAGGIITHGSVYKYSSSDWFAGVINFPEMRAKPTASTSPPANFGIVSLSVPTSPDHTADGTGSSVTLDQISTTSARIHFQSSKNTFSAGHGAYISRAANKDVIFKFDARH